MSKLASECRQIICDLCSWNKGTLLWVPGHSSIPGNADADVLATERSSTSFLGPESAIPISSSVGRLKIKEWRAKKHSEYWGCHTGYEAVEALHCRAFGKTV
jgi:hypothetical protein